MAQGQQLGTLEQRKGLAHRVNHKAGLTLAHIQHLDKTLAQLGRGGVFDLDGAHLAAGGGSVCLKVNCTGLFA